MGKNHGVSSKTHTKSQCNNYSNQNNPNNSAYKANQNNRANQNNPNYNRILLSKSEFQPDMWPGFIDD